MTKPLIPRMQYFYRVKRNDKVDILRRPHSRNPIIELPLERLLYMSDLRRAETNVFATKEAKVEVAVRRGVFWHYDQSESNEPHTYTTTDMYSGKTLEGICRLPIRVGILIEEFAERRESVDRLRVATQNAGPNGYRYKIWSDAPTQYIPAHLAGFLKKENLDIIFIACYLGDTRLASSYIPDLREHCPTARIVLSAGWGIPENFPPDIQSLPTISNVVHPEDVLKYLPRYK